MPSATVQLGKDIVISGISHARSVSVNNSASEADCTKFGDTSRKFKKTLIDQTVEVECVDSPGVDAGDEFTLSGTTTGDVKFIVTSVKEDNPIDGIRTFTVSGSRAEQ